LLDFIFKFNCIINCNCIAHLYLLYSFICMRLSYWIKDIWLIDWFDWVREIVQESLANAKAGARQPCVYDGPSKEIYGKSAQGTQCWKVHWNWMYDAAVADKWQYGSTCIFIRLAVVASQFREITRNNPKIRTYSSSGSSKIIDLRANRKHMQLSISLVVNSNFWRISHRFEISTHFARK